MNLDKRLAKQRQDRSHGGLISTVAVVIISTCALVGVAWLVRVALGALDVVSATLR